jgi:hypothetical protein
MRVKAVASAAARATAISATMIMAISGFIEPFVHLAELIKGAEWLA